MLRSSSSLQRRQFTPVLSSSPKYKKPQTQSRAKLSKKKKRQRNNSNKSNTISDATSTTTTTSSSTSALSFTTSASLPQVISVDDPTAAFISVATNNSNVIPTPTPIRPSILLQPARPPPTRPNNSNSNKSGRPGKGRAGRGLGRRRKKTSRRKKKTSSSPFMNIIPTQPMTTTINGRQRRIDSHSITLSDFDRFGKDYPRLRFYDAVSHNKHSRIVLLGDLMGSGYVLTTEERLKYGTFLPDRDIKKLVSEEEVDEIRKGEQTHVESTVPETTIDGSIDSSITEVEL